ncbi:hypothetical protein [Tepidibacter mesophilus]|uniref:hypothetical protein n=1 Tax=Tepidibacter mesophilus TaxID=655607 RepID=UPI000C0709EF|nr:hypothetical protein [Tepidibacter mesophilus]
MIYILRVIYIIFIGFMVYRMYKNGGCCGGHMSHSSDEKINVNKNKNAKKLIGEEDIKNAIDL